jgi:hypothetical protein
MSGVKMRLVDPACEACPFKGRFDLRPGRLRDIIDSCERTDSPFTCHRTIYGEGRAGDTDVIFGGGDAAVCGGWLEAAHTRGRVPSVVQIAERMDALGYGVVKRVQA